jgi:outer membrane protein assembly factor BamB
LRWAFDAGAPVTSPAILANGDLAIGVAASTDQLRIVSSSGTEVRRTTLRAPPAAGAFVRFPPSVGPTAIWVGSDDGRVYGVDATTGTVANGAGCFTGSAVRGPPAITAQEVAFVTAQSGAFHAATISDCRSSSGTSGFDAGPVLDLSGVLYGGSAAGTLISATFSPPLFSVPSASLAGLSVNVPLAVGSSGSVLSVSSDGALRATPGGVLASSIGAPTGGPIVLSNQDILVLLSDSTVRRFSSTGAIAWTAGLAGVPAGAVALTGSDGTIAVPTRAGSVHLLRDDGSEAWSGVLAAGVSLTDANIHTAPGSTTSTLYVGGGNTLFAVIVDGRLDTSAPWPKAHHDTRNSGNAAGPLP